MGRKYSMKHVSNTFICIRKTTRVQWKRNHLKIVLLRFQHTKSSFFCGINHCSERNTICATAKLLFVVFEIMTLFSAFLVTIHWKNHVMETYVGQKEVLKLLYMNKWWDENKAGGFCLLLDHLQRFLECISLTSRNDRGEYITAHVLVLWYVASQYNQFVQASDGLKQIWLF